MHLKGEESFQYSFRRQVRVLSGLTLVVNLSSVPGILLELPSSMLCDDLSKVSSDDGSEPKVLHPAGGKGVCLSSRDTVDEDKGVDEGEERVIGGDEGTHLGREFRVTLGVGPPNLLEHTRVDRMNPPK
jgi:hypothetical protein